MLATVRVRFGIKNALIFFPNAAIFIIRIPLKSYTEGLALAAQLRGILPDDLAARFVWERTE